MIKVVDVWIPKLFGQGFDPSPSLVCVKKYILKVINYLNEHQVFYIYNVFSINFNMFSFLFSTICTRYSLSKKVVFTLSCTIYTKSLKIRNKGKTMSPSFSYEMKTKYFLNQIDYSLIHYDVLIKLSWFYNCNVKLFTDII